MEAFRFPFIYPNLRLISDINRLTGHYSQQTVARSAGFISKQGAGPGVTQRVFTLSVRTLGPTPM